MKRNLIISLFVAIFTASLTLSGEIADDTDPYGNVPSVESCLLQKNRKQMMAMKNPLYHLSSISCHPIFASQAEETKREVTAVSRSVSGS